jgi:septation ring formation regulator EzrA
MDFSWLEERLNALNFRLIYCRRSRESFEAARLERLKVSGNPAQYDHLEAFIEEQETMDRLVAASRLPSLTVDVSHNQVARAADEIAQWLVDSDGLTMQEGC